MTERKWTIRNIDGTNPREVTLAEFRAELERDKANARAKFIADCERDGLPCYLTR